MNSSTRFRISGLPMDAFSGLFGLTDTELATRNARRLVADAKPGFPCRVSLVDAEPGETVILLPYAHHPVDGPYNSSGPIFVREKAKPAELEIDQIPEVAKSRFMSVRAYDADSWMLASGVAEGPDLEGLIRQFLSDRKVAYLHLHNAKPGCYSCRVDRA